MFEASTKVKQMCANTGVLEWGLRNYWIKGKNPKAASSTSSRSKRDVREVTKYIETALVLDKAMVTINFTLSSKMVSFLQQMSKLAH